jgi:hypothetical protein
MIPEQLELTPGMIRSLLAGLTLEQMVWKPAPDRFSIAEVLAHLAHAEHHAYASKYEQFAAEADSALEPYDTDAMVARGEYSGKDAVESLEDFERQRKENLARVRGLKDRTLRHKKVGPISLSHLLNECAYHDLGHIRQIAELVRALKYHPNMGLYSKFYKVSP